MDIPAILLPLFIQIFLFFFLLGWLAVARGKVIKAQGISSTDVAEGRVDWPQHAQRVARNFANQFELPILFALLIPLAILTRQADHLFIVMEWIFVISRLCHTFVQTTSNRLSLRAPIFAIGMLDLLLMWLIFAIHILLPPSGYR